MTFSPELVTGSAVTVYEAVNEVEFNVGHDLIPFANGALIGDGINSIVCGQDNDFAFDDLDPPAPDTRLHSCLDSFGDVALLECLKSAAHDATATAV
jgi:hypothetical protein